MVLLMVTSKDWKNHILFPGYAGPSVKGDSALKEDEAEAEKLRWQRYHLKDKEED